MRAEPGAWEDHVGQSLRTRSTYRRGTIMCRRWLPPLFAAAMMASLSYAQPPQPQPVIELRVQSINELLSKADYLAGLVGQQDAVRGVLQQIPIDPKSGLFGIDPTRPIGVYGDISLDLESGTGVALIPVADINALLGALQAFAGIQAERKGNGIIVVPLPPGGPIDTLYGRVQDGYLYLAGKEADLNPKSLIRPQNFFVKDNAAISLSVYPERIPSIIRREILAKAKEQVEEAKLVKDPKRLEDQAYLLGAKLGLDTLRLVLEDVRQIDVKLVVNDKQDHIALEAHVVPRPNSGLAKNIQSLEQKMSQSAGITMSKNAVIRGHVSFALTDDYNKKIQELIDAAIKDALMNAPAEEREVARAVLSVLASIARSGQIDAGFSLSGPDSRGRHTALVALRAPDQRKIQEAFDTLVQKYIQETGNKQAVQSNYAQVGGFRLHRIDQIPDEEFSRFFGSRSVWVAISDKMIVVSMGPDDTALKRALSAPAVTVPPFSVEISMVGVARMDAIIEPQKAQPLAAIVRQIFGPAGPAGRDTLRLELSGGDRLILRGRIDGKAISLIAAMAQIEP